MLVKRSTENVTTGRKVLMVLYKSKTIHVIKNQVSHKRSPIGVDYSEIGGLNNFLPNKIARAKTTC